MNTNVLTGAAAAILLCVCGWMFADRAVEEKRYTIAMILLFLFTAFGCGFLVRFFQTNQPDNTLGIAIMKACSSLPTVTFALRGYLKSRTFFHLLLLLGIIISMTADVAINLSFFTGIIIFAAAHILFDIAFILRKRPGIKQILLWLLLSIPAALLPYIYRAQLGDPAVMYFAMFYLSILISTCIFSYPLHKMIFLAAAVFTLSDILLIINMIIPPAILMNIAALLVYYLSLILYGICIWNEY